MKNSLPGKFTADPCGPTAVAQPDGTLEVDEVYIVAGHEGQPAEVEKRDDQDSVAGFKARRDAVRWRRRSRQSSA